MRVLRLDARLIGLMMTVTVACVGDDSPIPGLIDRGVDAGADAGQTDSGPAVSPDGGLHPPVNLRAPDAQAIDETIVVANLGDGGISDALVDSGLPGLPDADADTISDADEGNGTVDTDGDGQPDSEDPDADGDGIPDIIEAGDPDVRTPAIDTDGDGTPDYRDLDSDNDTIADADEGRLDPDRDNIAAYIDLDADGDGIPDTIEGTTDTDGDGTGDFVDLDADGDGVADVIETDADYDNDGIGNWRDLESDGDGLSDALEGEADPDNDGQPAFVDLDADGDTMADEDEGTIDFDGDGIGAWLDIDSDGDTLSDADELLQDPDNDNQPAFLDLDSDGDGLADATEAGDDDLETPPADPDGDNTPSYLDLDSDNDTIFDSTEGAADQDGDGRPSFVDTDADGDGIPDAVEAGDTSLATAPIDTDNDGFGDFVDPDSDNDLILDAHEGQTNSDSDALPDYRDSDSDNDGRPDAAEAGDASLTTAPIDTDGDGDEDFRDTDADGDGFSDAAETGCPGSTNHLLADSDADGLADPIEIAVATDPCDNQSAVNGLFLILPPLGASTTATIPFDETEIDRADLALNIDSSGSMGGEIMNLGSSLTSLIIPGMQAAVREPGFSVSSFEDFPISPFGASDVGDRPFRLLSRVTTDAAQAQTAVNSLTLRNGADIPESGLESLYQVASGAGAQWGPGVDEQVPAFDNAVGLLPGVADGPIGGVGFRTDALPIIVHMTDSSSHLVSDYQAVSGTIGAAPAATIRSALDAIGARVISIDSGALARPVLSSVTDEIFADSCRRRAAQFFGRIDGPSGTDVDWYALTGVDAGATVSAETTAARVGSTLDSVVGLVDATGTTIALNDNLDSDTDDSRVTATLAGTAPFYIAVSDANDVDFDGTGAASDGYYFLDIVVDGVGYTVADPTCPGLDMGSTRADATGLIALDTAPPGSGACEATCSTEIADDALALPYGIAQSTGATIPPCAWDEFGVRPPVCGTDECCTGPGGLGRSANADGLCPLSFEVGTDGAGLGDAIVTGLTALVRFSTFEITTAVRGDPNALTNQGIDTRCFIHGVVPNNAVPPHACAPTPIAGTSGWTNVIPGTDLGFRIDAENRVASGTTPCVASGPQPAAFRAFVDVIADGVTVVDTQTITIVVPAATN